MLTRSKYGSPLNNQEGNKLRWVPPALSSQRHRTHGFNLSYPPSEKTFPWDEEPGDLTSRDRFLLSGRLNESKGIVACNQASSNSSSPYMKGCQTMEELIQLATSQGDLSPTQLAAFWSRMPRLLSMTHNQDHCHVKKKLQQLKNDLKSILAQTTRKVEFLFWGGKTRCAFDCST